MFKKTLVLVLGLLLVCAPVFAQDAQSKADLAVANILFDYDFGSEFASYRIDENGFVDIIIASNTPNEIYVEILNRLENHPDIDGVLASNSGPACKVSGWEQ